MEKNNGSAAVQKREPTMAERFTNAVVKEFSSIAGKIELTPYQRRLAQHLFLKIDTTLAELEKKRRDQNKPEIAWKNINMTKLATDAMHRVDLGLDALIPGHIYPIPYLNTRTNKYDLDLRIGYKGKDYYRRTMATEQPMDIRYELVYSKDKFRPIKKGPQHPEESYDFEVADTPFDRGEVIGGFGYIEYENPKKNVLILVTAKDFQKSAAKAQSQDFWVAYPDEMKYKTIVNRTTDKLPVDPQKVSAAFLAVEKEEEYIDIEVVSSHIAENANIGPVLEIAPEMHTNEDEDAAIEKEIVQEAKAEVQTEKAAPKKGPGF